MLNRLKIVFEKFRIFINRIFFYFFQVRMQLIGQADIANGRLQTMRHPSYFIKIIFLNVFAKAIQFIRRLHEELAKNFFFKIRIVARELMKIVEMNMVELSV